MFTKIITNPRFRSFLRNTGILKVLKRAVSKRNKNYEELFDKAMMSSIKQGDIVWDIGANIGFYTCKFAHAVGNTGKVVAFEPVKETYLRMVAACEKENLSNVLPLQCALGSFEEQIDITVDTTSNATTSSLVKKSDNSARYELVAVKRGDSLIAEGISAPTILKIDVEAYEEEVLFGLRNYLQYSNMKGGGGKILKINILRSAFRAVG
jgi:FkbM family methyltransferase